MSLLGRRLVEWGGKGGEGGGLPQQALRDRWGQAPSCPSCLTSKRFVHARRRHALQCEEWQNISFQHLTLQTQTCLSTTSLSDHNVRTAVPDLGRGLTVVAQPKNVFARR